MAKNILKTEQFLLNPISKTNLLDFPIVKTTIHLYQDLIKNANFLDLHYQIFTKAPYDFASFDKNLVKPSDFLWEKNCLECFITDNHKSYFEINASPTGAYALYQFDDYRLPKQMPPKATNALQFFWENQTINQIIRDFDDNNFLSSFSFLIQLPINFQLTKINPTVILYQDNQPIFYAVNHASPPDFHDKSFWLNF